MGYQKVNSGSPFEKLVGFCRAVRAGNSITVAGTAPIAEDGSTASPGDMYGQTQRCLEIIKKAIEEAGGEIGHVIRTRVMLTDISRWEEAARAHQEMFARIEPTCTFVEVSGLISDEWLVEIEADCSLPAE